MSGDGSEAENRLLWREGGRGKEILRTAGKSLLFCFMVASQRYSRAIPNLVPIGCSWWCSWGLNPSFCMQSMFSMLSFLCGLH